MPGYKNKYNTQHITNQHITTYNNMQNIYNSNNNVWFQASVMK